MNRINEINITRVLQKIWFSRGISRADLARELGLVKSTVTKIVTMLIDRDIIRTAAEGQSDTAIGRKPLNLVINDRFGYILGIEIQTEFFTAVAINLHGEILFSRSEQLSMAGKDVEAGFFEVMDRLRDPMGGLNLRLLGIGIGLAGIIDPTHGVIVQSNPLNISEPYDLLGKIHRRLDVPVVIENDANCCSWGELAFKKTLRHDNFLFVLGEFRRGETSNTNYWGIAIGLALVLNGRVYSGSSFSAGEFQSLFWKDGNMGQLSLTNAEAARIKEDSAVMARALRELCAHIAFLVNTLNLTSVVFGGELASRADDLREILPDEIQKNWSYDNMVDCRIEFSTLSDKVVAYGAAGMFLESIFSIPEMIEKPGQRESSRVAVLLN